MQDNRDLMNDFDWAAKSRQHLPAKVCAFGPEMKRILKYSKKFLRFFDRNLYGKLTFFHHFLLNISWITYPAPKVKTCRR